MKTHIILASHGSLAEGMVTAVRMVIRDMADAIFAFGLDRWETPQAIRAEAEAIVKRNPEDQHLILCDIKGGSVANDLMPLCVQPGVFVITGMNLAMVISLVLQSQSGAVLNRTILEGYLEEVANGICCFDAGDFKETNQEGDGELW